MKGDQNQLLFTNTPSKAVLDGTGMSFISEDNPIIIPESAFINPAVEALKREAAEFEGYVVSRP